MTEERRLSVHLSICRPALRFYGYVGVFANTDEDTMEFLDKFPRPGDRRPTELTSDAYRPNTLQLHSVYPPASRIR